MKPEAAAYYLHSIVDPRWYESLDVYANDRSLEFIVREYVDDTWSVDRRGIWYYVTPHGGALPDQGWKLHVSATQANAAEVLRRTVMVTRTHRARFKFAVDEVLAGLQTSKIWPREAGGKFITIYPASDDSLRRLASDLASALGDLAAPYVLSDRRYEDCPALHYRYGAFKPRRVLSVKGTYTYLLTSPDGATVPDRRLPYWSPPAWAQDPFEQTATSRPSGSDLIGDGRYRVVSALSFTTFGGVYLAVDQDDGRTVVLKEARPAVGLEPSGADAQSRLRTEYELLRHLAGTGYVPRAIELFTEWEHLFLAEEFIPGHDLGRFTIAYSPLMRVAASAVEIEGYVEILHRLWTRLADAVDRVHADGVILGDLSVKNVISKNRLGDLRIIDLEAAWRPGIDQPTNIATPGFTSPTRRLDPNPADDVYAMGATFLGTLFPNAVLAQKRAGEAETLIAGLCDRVSLPPTMGQILRACIAEDADQRPSPADVVAELRQVPTRVVPVVRSAPSVSPVDVEGAVRRTLDAVSANATVHRDDRLFPGDPALFATNPLSIAYGAAGVHRMLSYCGREIPADFLAWMDKHRVVPAEVPPGLYVGMSGIAWSCFDLGQLDRGDHVLREASGHPSLWADPTLHFGASGYGLACLRAYLATDDQGWLDRAAQVLDFLNSHRQQERQTPGCWWRDEAGSRRLGMAAGNSGIALFLLYFHALTRDDSALELGRAAMSQEIAHLRTTDEGTLSVPRGVVGKFETVVSHYWYDGSAGVASTLLRYVAIGEDSMRPTFDALELDTRRTFTAFPGLFRGLAGLGNLQLDCHHLLGDRSYLNRAWQMAAGLLSFAIDDADGTTFPGEQLMRRSLDFATGSAGVAGFLHRLSGHRDRRPDFNLTLDQVLDKSPAEQSTRRGDRA